MSWNQERKKSAAKKDRVFVAVVLCDLLRKLLLFLLRCCCRGRTKLEPSSKKDNFCLLSNEAQTSNEEKLKEVKNRFNVSFGFLFWVLKDFGKKFFSLSKAPSLPKTIKAAFLRLKNFVDDVFWLLLYDPWRIFCTNYVWVLWRS